MLRASTKLDHLAPVAFRVPAISVLSWLIMLTLFGGLVFGTTRFCGMLVVAGFISQDLLFYRRPVKKR